MLYCFIYVQSVITSHSPTAGTSPELYRRLGLMSTLSQHPFLPFSLPFFSFTHPSPFPALFPSSLPFHLPSYPFPASLLSSILSLISSLKAYCTPSCPQSPSALPCNADMLKYSLMWTLSTATTLPRFLPFCPFYCFYSCVFFFSSSNFVAFFSSLHFSLFFPPLMPKLYVTYHAPPAPPPHPPPSSTPQSPRARPTSGNERAQSSSMRFEASARGSHTPVTSCICHRVCVALNGGFYSIGRFSAGDLQKECYGFSSGTFDCRSGDDRGLECS